ncbi:hypothetical protein [Lactococcus chungangensis]|uniref:hypothetical protein n=1 Tax=Pseudolactococcus chungangensis TaxID=451457 RepID=UPI003735235C
MVKQIKKIQVIKILDEFTVLINIGSSSGKINVDDKIVIYEEGPQIEDIDGTSLGNFEFTKATLLVTDVQNNFSVAKHSKKTQPLSSLNLLGSNTLSSKGSLSLNENTELTPLVPKNMDILIGDLVKIV